MAKDLNKVEKTEVVDLEYLLQGYRNQIRSAQIYKDVEWVARTEQRHIDLIADHQRQLDTLRHMRDNADAVIADCQKKIQQLLKQIKHKKHKADIERLIALADKLNANGVDADTIAKLRERFGKEIEDDDTA